MRHAAAFARLTLFNARRLLFGPFLLPAAALFLLHFTWPGTRTGQSVDSWYSGMFVSALFIAMIGFGSVTPSAVREARHPVISSTPLGRTGRITALALAAALLQWSLLAGTGLWLWTSAGPPPPAGVISPLALPVPFLIAAMGPLGSLLLVLWTRSYLPLALFALCLPLYLVYSGVLVSERLDNAVSRAAMALQQAVSPFPDFSVSLARMNFFSLVYTCLVTAALSVLVLGARRTARTVAATSAAAALLLTGAAAAVDLHSVSRARHSTGSGHAVYADTDVHGVQDPWPCREVEGVTYCPLPGYDSWIPSWKETVDLVLDELPEAARADAPVVWQGSERYTRAFDVPRAAVTVTDHTAEDSHPWHSQSYVSFARKTLGMSTGTPAPYDLDACKGTGQARTVVVAWVVDRVIASFRPDDLAFRTERIAVSLTDLGPSPADLALGRRIPSIPPDRMRALLEEHWDRVSSGEMDTLELAALLEVPVAQDQDRVVRAAEWDTVFLHRVPAPQTPWNPHPPPCPVGS